METDEFADKFNRRPTSEESAEIEDALDDEPDDALTPDADEDEDIDEKAA